MGLSPPLTQRVTGLTSNTLLDQKVNKSTRHDSSHRTSRQPKQHEQEHVLMEGLKNYLHTLVSRFSMYTFFSKLTPKQQQLADSFPIRSNSMSIEQLSIYFVLVSSVALNGDFQPSNLVITMGGILGVIISITLSFPGCPSI